MYGCTSSGESGELEQEESFLELFFGNWKGGSDEGDRLIGCARRKAVAYHRYLLLPGSDLYVIHQTFKCNVLVQ